MSDDDEGKGKKGKNKKVMMIGAVALAGAAYKFVLAPAPSDAAAEGEAAAEEEVVEGDVAPVPELVVNLADTDQVHYVRVGVAVVLAEGIDPGAFETQLPKVSDVVIDIISSKTFDEVRGAGATVELKDEISEATREVFPEGEVVRVIFTTFVTQ